MTISRLSNGKFYLFSDDGSILHSEKDLETMYKWCAEYFLGSLAHGKIIYKEK